MSSESIDSLLTRPDKSTKNKRLSAKPYNTRQRPLNPSDSGKWGNDLYIKSIGGELGARMLNPSLFNKQAGNTTDTTHTPLGSRISGLATRQKKNEKKQQSINIRGSSHQPTQIIINNLAPGTSQEDVKVALSPYGNILHTSPNPVNSSDDSLAMNIFFERLVDAQSALKAFDGLHADGKVLVVNLVEKTALEDVHSLFSDRKMYADSIAPTPSPRKSKDTNPKIQSKQSKPRQRKENPPAKPVLSILERTQMQPKAKKKENTGVQSGQSGQSGQSLLDRMSVGGGLSTQGTQSNQSTQSARRKAVQSKQPGQTVHTKTLAERLGM
ncbi:hypothetical protein E3P92_00504 [Wallemia ichthyophaga]|nr:hypothetical protein E3P95_00560 [Wallemia ichthyophaga]TIB04137.1 hypothetical protein E3P94_00710 [Wallemia ichthyophaga]TIB18678.1 hypothetical protein E3P92_00504 [Wallemia ichthyophaga]